jgi:hypothetical protein
MFSLMADLTSPFILLMIATERADINHLVLVYLFITLFVLLFLAARPFEGALLPCVVKTAIV